MPPRRPLAVDDSENPNGEALGGVGRVAEAMAVGFSSDALRLHLDRLLHQSSVRFLRSPPRRRRKEGSFGLADWDQS